MKAFRKEQVVFVDGHGQQHGFELGDWLSFTSEGIEYRGLIETIGYFDFELLDECGEKYSFSYDEEIELLWN